ncbi:MAG: hypothetical protein IJZ68_13230 [Bacteroidaceae bacterium]|nr:hypothetical protein [Bacteroidaceae bacterium]
MKKLNKMLALCLALTMLLVCVPLTASATETTYGPENIQEIPGIDYNRITQKATGGGKSYPVELKMGDLTFTGELSGSHGLSYEELNMIINEVLKEKNLTADRIALVAKLAGRVETDAALYWGDQIIQGLLSFIPTPPGSPGGVNDYYAWIVHGEGKGVGSMAAESALSTAVTAAEIALNPSTGQYFSKIPFAATTGTDKVPLLGQLINTFKVGKEWLEGNKQLEKYLDLLEKNLADINGFYSECSRRANELAEEKGAGSYVIKFDKEKNHCTYNATFWGISDLTMGATLSGVLEGSNTKGVAGTYTGTLWLDLELETPDTFDAAIPNAYPFSQSYNVLKPLWDMQKKDPTMFFGGEATHYTTVLKRAMQGEITVTVTENTGIVNCDATGSITSGNDETEFKFDHMWDNAQLDIVGSVGGAMSYEREYQYYHYTSSDPKTLTETTHTSDAETRAHPLGEGTVWKPLESDMVITIDFRK